jgi:DNA-directed RNA polymerase specialized sigma24 family protein
LRGKFASFFRTFSVRYYHLLKDECDHIDSFIDWHLFKCIHKFDLERDYFYSYVRETLNNAIKDIFKKRAARTRAGFAPTYLEGLTEEEIELLVSKEVTDVSTNKVEVIRDHLAPLHQEVLDLRLQNVPEYMIQEMFGLSYREFKNIIKTIRTVSVKISEV